MNQLEQQLESAVKDPAQVQNFIKNLMSAEVYCLGHLVDDHDHQEHSEACEHDSEVSIIHWEDTRGNIFVPFFTSLDAMVDIVGEDEPYLCIQGRNFLDLTQGETLLLNPESDLEWSFSAEEVRKILKPLGH
ncbi:MAG: enhanced serine sensitivity protein SseB [Gammaproteobacteria bacterium]|jgi:hypothetical protein|nr:enhanced serine sensitivity protein SseB [Gammaproteobacteria bacterium]